MPIHDDRRIFPVVLNEVERILLKGLSTGAGLSRGALIRELLYREYASRRLTTATHEAKPEGA